MPSAPVTRTNKGIPVHVALLALISNCRSNSRGNLSMPALNGKLDATSSSLKRNREVIETRYPRSHNGRNDVSNLNTHVTRLQDKCGDKDSILRDLAWG